MDSALAQLRSLEPGYLEAEIGIPPEDLLPIGGSAVQRDMFFLAKRSSPTPGVVIWFASGEIDRYPSFDEFYLAMLDYNRLEVEYLEGEAR